jgi:hypothetical protein
MTMSVSERRLQKKTIALRDRVIFLAREIEEKFGKEDDRTIFTRNAYCELQEVANMLETDADAEIAGKTNP